MVNIGTLFGVHHRGCSRLPDARILAPEGAGLLRRNVKCRDIAWRRARHVNRVDTISSWPTSPACIDSNPQPHKRFSNEKAWIRKALLSYDHTAIFEKCIPAGRTGGLRRSRPGFSVTIAGGIIPQQQAGSWNSRRSRPGSAVTIAGGVIPQQQAVSLELIMSL
jgi:hypothetical protein